MPIENYDTWGIDEMGRDLSSASVMLMTPLGIRARIHKDWLSIEDQEGRAPDKRNIGYMPPMVVEVQWGRLSYKDLHVCAQKKDGVFFVAAWTFHAPLVHTAFYGVSRYAFEGDRYVGVVAEHIQAFYEWLEKQHKEEDVPLPRLPMSTFSTYDPGVAYRTRREG